MAKKSRLSALVMRALVRCVTGCVDNAGGVIAFAAVITILSLAVTVIFLTVNTDTNDMIDPICRSASAIRISRTRSPRSTAR